VNIRLLVLAFVMAAIPAFLNGQQQSGRLPLSGTVIDRTGAGVADAGVSLIRHSARQQQRAPLWNFRLRRPYESSLG
jgi:hypothetical protein